MSDYISIKDDRFWEILFDEACVEGKQAERIKKELEKITVDEKEIIRKPIERIIERLEEEERTLQDKYERNLKKEYDDPFVSGRLCELECVIEIVKEEGGIE